MRRIAFAPEFSAFKEAAKAALAQQIAPADCHFVGDATAQAHLFAAPEAPSSGPGDARVYRLPKAYVTAAQEVALHRDSGRWDLLYRLLWRLTQGEPQVLAKSHDPDVLALTRMQAAVRKDVHHCHAYVRFVPLDEPDAPGGKHYVAWYEPEHRIITLAADHFVERFASMRWSIMTPDACVHFADGTLTVGPGATRAQVPPAGDEDAIAQLWQTYYTHIFNPARVNLRATRQQMPQKFWKNMKETQLIMPLVRDAEQASQTFIASQPGRAVAKANYLSLEDARADAGGCTVCPWAKDATQTVFGEGPTEAPLMVVGEQPGDSEDVAGRPFVGPAGNLLMRALAEAGIAREALYITNAVKHFKFEPRGKRRIHQKPNATDVAACRAWLGAELKVVRPKVLLCLGTTAALAIFGKATKLKDVRGSWHNTAACARTFVTTHPSAILRMPPEAQAEGFAQLVGDLRQVKTQVEQVTLC